MGNKGARKFPRNKMDAMLEIDDRNVYAQDTSNLFQNLEGDDDDDERNNINAGRRTDYDDDRSMYDDEYSVASVPPPRTFGNKDIFKPVLRNKPKANKRVTKYGGSPVKFKKAHPF